MFICKHCGKECKNKNSLVQHEIRCKLNPNKLNLEYLENVRLKIKRFKELTSSEKRKSYNMKKQYDFIEYKMKAIGDYLYYRLGQIKIEIPEEVKDKIKTKSKAKKITDFIYRK